MKGKQKRKKRQLGMKTCVKKKAHDTMLIGERMSGGLEK